jgi:hypothetical protein
MTNKRIRFKKKEQKLSPINNQNKRKLRENN